MSRKLLLLRSIHSAVFWFQVGCLAYILYAGVTRTFSVLLVVPVVSISINGLLLLRNRGRCPLTTLAERQGAASGMVTDMFLPAWLAPNVFRVSIVFFPLELILLAVRFFTGL